jgi:hypothetical protein
VSHGSVAALLAGVVVLGVGIALAFAGMSTLIIAAVPPEDIGIATGINTIMRTIGASFGTALVTAILTADTDAATGLPLERAYVTAFVLAAGIALAGVGAALWIPRDVHPMAGRGGTSPEAAAASANVGRTASL